MPLPKRRSSTSSSPRRTWSGIAGLPPSTTMGRDDQVVVVDQSGPECVCREVGPSYGEVNFRTAFSCRTASGSKSRSIRVLALETVSSALEYTILSAARQISAES
jgi:hypothetical protein